MAGDMIRRAQRAGIEADYLLADAWFGTKPIIRLADEQLLTPILRMKKNTMKYRLTECKGGQAIHRDRDVNTLYQSFIRCQWQKILGQPYQAKALDVELNLSSSPDEADQWIKVRLLFVRGIAQPEKEQPGKHDWAVFLTTDTNLESHRILELYAMRWAIEVYFKEAKQYLGFLKEQSNHYAARLWQVFRSVIAGAMDETKMLIGDTASQIMATIERHVQSFFVQALQLDVRTLRLEAK
jgi:SRSO17 transposase